MKNRHRRLLRRDDLVAQQVAKGAFTEPRYTSRKNKPRTMPKRDVRSWLFARLAYLFTPRSAGDVA